MQRLGARCCVINHTSAFMQAPVRIAALTVDGRIVMSVILRLVAV
jgi:hypothetical protein